MLAPPQNAMEKMKQTEFYKHLIYEAFCIIDIDKKGYIDRKEVSYIMRYLLQFPSEAQIRDYIIDQLEGDEPSDYIKYEKFEPYMLQVLLTNEYEPNPAEHLLAAFRVLDPKGEGFIRKDVMKELLTTKGIHLRPREYFNFINFAQDKSGTKIYYEDYVTKLIEENERHREHLTKDYETFKPSSGNNKA